MQSFFRKVISCSLSPNTEADDVRLALKVLFSPRLWQEGEATGEVENWFKQYFKVESCVSFNSGRSALLALLQALGIGKSDEVLTQAFTCVAVPNSLIWAGAKPVFVDIDESFNLDVQDAEKKLSPQTKAVIIQHTYGIPARMEQILSFAEKHKLFVIEDCAHALGGKYQGKKLGTLGDAAFFSFGRDKVLSSVWGGVALINAKCQMTNAKNKLKEIQKSLPMPSKFWILQQLLHPLAFPLILASYNLGIGKGLLFLLQRLGLLSLPVYRGEKRGIRPDDFPAKYPNALAILLLNQLQKLAEFNQRRRASAANYWLSLRSHPMIRAARPVSGAIYLRYPIRMKNPLNPSNRAKAGGVLLGNWYHHIIDPAGVDLAAVGYQLGSCPQAETAARQILNLPTLISASQRDLVLKCLL